MAAGPVRTVISVAACITVAVQHTVNLFRHDAGLLEAGWVGESQLQPNLPFQPAAVAVKLLSFRNVWNIEKQPLELFCV